ncbi:unnamed protein product [Albugo candida]|uniref:GPI mannosyltransferase 1 n=1 Tax=Albugo candida TaxID=65357 RepID=A0A024GHG3_9STRA|nr:unnamed protein product [Albugo candida]|eukprot:CCI45916.1 unnamed protein product [Albugo candida]
MTWNAWTVSCAAMLPRVLLILFGSYQDATMSVKYTDVDYDVYTDASRLVVDGFQSPFDRTTYRYTPILAYLLTMNVVINPLCGKIFFAIGDIIVGLLLMKILRLQGLNTSEAIKYTCIWLFHPFSINISTRGNADVIVVMLVMATIYFLVTKRTWIAAIFFGFAVHFKIYPIVYTLALLMCLDRIYDVTSRPVITSNTRWGKPLRWINWNRFTFGIISGLTFMALLILFYQIYGYPFLYETYLYHLIRTDNRHNFSVYFYDLYLRYNTSAGVGLGLLAFVPQMLTIIVISIRFGRDLCFSLFLLTYVFVIFNKVCTAQYFLWYTAFLPLILPYSKLSLLWKGSWLILIWLGAELHWLYWAYYLEMKGANTFLHLWMAGLLFFCVNVYILVTFIQKQRLRATFQDGKINSVGISDKVD